MHMHMQPNIVLDQPLASTQVSTAAALDAVVNWGSASAAVGAPWSSSADHGGQQHSLPQACSAGVHPAHTNTALRHAAGKAALAIFCQ
jgi:hypothetical protein